MTRVVHKTLWIGGLCAFLLAQGAVAEDLPRDERILTGRLDNGVTWMYRQHKIPPGKLALMINIDTGSLNESDQQRGLAHFLEHMAFNGSENFPPGELIPYFESIGMDFGGDINAFTSFDQTAYMIFLPNTDPAEIDKALMVLSDQAFRLSLLREEIDKERGVILAERRSGLSAQQRIRDKLWPQLFAGTRFAQRLPIGQEETIKNAPRDEFVDYYRTWYRPERLTVMIVGDQEPGPVLPVIEKWFGQYKAEAATRPEQSPGFEPFTEQRAIIVTDPEYAGCEVAMYNVRPSRGATTTVEQARADLVEYLGTWIVNRRLSDRIKKGNASFRDAGLTAFDFFEDALLVIGTVEGEPEDWEKMLAELVEEVSRARQYGFTEREFELAKKEILADAERAVRTEPSQNGRRILMQINGSVNNGEPLLSAQQELDLLKRNLPTISLADVATTFMKNFTPGSFAYVLTAPEKEGVEVPVADQLLAAARAALTRQVAPPEEQQDVQGLVENLPEPGRAVERTTDEALGVTHLWLENGVRVHHRFMDYKKDQVFLSIALAGGKIEETGANAGVTEVASLILSQPATSRLNSTEIEDYLTGKNIRVRGSAGTDALVLNVSGSPDDLETGLELAHALLTDGKLEESAFDNWKRSNIQQYEMFSKMPQFIAIREIQKVVSGNDPRMEMLTPERIHDQSVERSQAWFENLIATASIEVSIVGEMQLDDALPLIENYLGSLSKRPRDAARLDSLRNLARKPGPIVTRESVETITPQAMVVACFMGPQRRDWHDTQGIELASKTLDSRLIKQIREELGLVYSIGMQTMPGEVFEDSGMVFSGAPCDPEEAEQVVAEIQKIYDDFAKDGPTTEELATAKKQLLNDLDTGMKEPRFWQGVMRHIDLHKLDLGVYKTIKEDYEAFTPEQVRAAFAKYYKPERWYAVIARPTEEGSPVPQPEAEQPAVGAATP